MKNSIKILRLVGIILFVAVGLVTYGQTVKNLKTDFGAKGDGFSDDSKAWHDAIEYFNGKKNGRLKIPKGIYRIGTQEQNISNRAFYSKYKFRLSEASNIHIEGAVDVQGNPASVFKYNDNLYFGYFQNNGKAMDKASDKNRAELEPFLRIEPSCNGIKVENIEVDGNLAKTNLGIVKTHNLAFIGIYINGAGNVELENIYVHHLGLDGIYIRAAYDENKVNVLLNKIISEYNGRQGLSFTGGRGIKVINSKFRYTGKGGLSLSPSANVDIENHEAKNKYIENIAFENCELIDNAGGSGSLNLAGLIRNFKMTNCKIETTNWLSIQSNYSPSRDFMFENCVIKGAIEFQINGNQKLGQEITKFINCTISDNKNTKKVGVGRSLINVLDNVEFDNCNFYIWDKRNLIHSYNNGQGDKKKNTVLFKNCSFNSVDKGLNIKEENITKTKERINFQNTRK